MKIIFIGVWMRYQILQKNFIQVALLILMVIHKRYSHWSLVIH